jgi:RHS repeat-associated protein
VYDGDNLLHEVDVNRGVERSYAHGLEVDDQLLLRDAVSGSLYFYCHDALNSVVALTDTGGSRVQQYEYKEYGSVISRHSITFSQPFGFTGREFDFECAWLHLRARKYDPSIGRFATEDPIGVMGGMNLYRYVENNPIMYTDLFGLQNKTVFTQKELDELRNGAKKVYEQLAKKAAEEAARRKLIEEFAKKPWIIRAILTCLGRAPVLLPVLPFNPVRNPWDPPSLRNLQGGI